MEFKNKLLLISLFFLGICFWNSSKVFAQFEEMSNCPYYDTFISQISSYPQYNDTCNYACIQNTSNNYTYYVVSNLPQYPYFAIAHYYYDRGDGTMRNQPNIVNVKYNEDNTLTVTQNKFLVVMIDENAIVSTSTKKSVSLPSAYSNYSILYSKADFYYSKITQNIMLPSTLSDPEKIVLDTPPIIEQKGEKVFQLNLIDKNFNDTKHTFTLKANKEDIRYNELMELINNENNYCIYLTDYTRLLTYENKRLDCPLKSRLVFNVTAT